MAMRLAPPVGAIAENRNGLTITTPAGNVSARAVILTVSTNVLAGTSIDLPSTLDPWRDAASRLPLGSNEKLFLQLDREAPFLPETHLIGNPYDSRTCDFYIRPFGWPVISVATAQGSSHRREWLPASSLRSSSSQSWWDRTSVQSSNPWHRPTGPARTG
jgi:hypothetical protein